MGRHWKLTPEVHGKIVAEIGRGIWDYVAAQTAGIGAATFRKWIARGEGQDPKRPCTKALAAFAADVRQARARARAEREAAVAQQNLLAWLRMTGRDRPGEPGWTDTQRHEVTGPTGPTGTSEPLNFKLIIGCPALEKAEAELFKVWFADLSTAERATFSAVRSGLSPRPGRSAKPSGSRARDAPLSGRGGGNLTDPGPDLGTPAAPLPASHARGA